MIKNITSAILFLCAACAVVATDTESIVSEEVFYSENRVVKRGPWASTRGRASGYRKADPSFCDFRTTCPECHDIINGEASQPMENHLRAKHNAEILKVKPVECVLSNVNNCKWKIIYKIPL